MIHFVEEPPVIYIHPGTEDAWRRIGRALMRGQEQGHIPPPPGDAGLSVGTDTPRGAS